MMKKVVLLAFVLVLFSMSMLGTRLEITVSASTTHHVYPGESIQEAINSAQPGDTIFVHNGTYYEHVVVNKTVSLFGEDRSTTIIDGSHPGPLLGIVRVSVSYVTVEGFTIRNNYNPNDMGINLDWSSNSTVRKCIIQNTTSHGIWLGYGSFPEFSYGGHVIADNLITKNLYSGVRIDCGNNKVINNNITDNGEGIYLTYMYDGHENIISNNTVFNNGWGIHLLGSNHNIISNNDIAYNIEGGIWLRDSDNNTIYHNNFINNTIQASLETSFGSMWDDGYPSGGNYWSNYQGTDYYSGPHQNVTGSDGIGDTSYVIDGNNQDNYPLMQPYHGPVRNLNTGQSYPTIQEAINNASEGDRIFALSGTYYENVVVNITISLIGENRSTTIIDGSRIGTVVTINTNNVNISGFMIQNSGPSVSAWDWPPDSGVLFADGSTGNFFGGNTIQNNGFGVVLDRCNNNTLKNNNITGNIYNFYVSGDLFYGCHDWLHDIDETNTVDGKPIRYWINQHDKQIPTDSGCVYAINSTNILVKDVKVAHNGNGITLVVTDNSTIENVNVSTSLGGIWLVSSVGNRIVGNTLTKNYYAIFLHHSPNNTVIGNMMSNNSYGIALYSYYFEYTQSNNNLIVGNTISNSEVAGMYLPENANSHNSTIYHNNFINNTKHVDNFDSINFWDNGVEGNHWSNYTGVDSDHDGIGDSSHILDADNQDNYPLMGMFSEFNVTSEYHVQTICNSSISNFQFNGTAICFNVTGESGTTGFCRICIPRALMNETYKVFVNGTEVQCNLLPCSNTTHSYLYFTYNLSTQEVIIIPEFPAFLIPPLFMITTLLAVIIYRRKYSK